LEIAIFNSSKLGIPGIKATNVVGPIAMGIGTVE
jgi:hypothetical protein